MVIEWSWSFFKNMLTVLWTLKTNSRSPCLNPKFRWPIHLYRPFCYVDLNLSYFIIIIILICILGSCRNNWCCWSPWEDSLYIVTALTLILVVDVQLLACLQRSWTCLKKIKINNMRKHFFLFTLNASGTSLKLKKKPQPRETRNSNDKFSEQ